MVATIATVGAGALGYTAAAAIAGLFLITWPLERIWRRHPVHVRRLGLRTDLAYAVASPVLQFVGLVVGGFLALTSLLWVPALALRPLVAATPAWLQLVVGILVVDLVMYWTHRLSHTVPLLWRFHAVHHSTTHLDWVSGFRAHPFDGLFAAPAFAVLLAAGVPLEVTGALAGVQFVVGLWSHLNVRWKLRPLRRIVLTPDFHHWHHANHPEAIDTNFSTFLPVWDILFGTFRLPDHGPTRYGIDEPMPTGIVAQLRHPLRGVRLPRRRVRLPHATG